MAEPSSGDSTVNLRQRPSDEERERDLKRLGNDLPRRWRAGQRAAVETLLVERAGLVEDPEAVFVLLCAEYQAREELGEQPAVEEYRQRFPSHAPQLEHEISRRRTLRR